MDKSIWLQWLRSKDAAPVSQISAAESTQVDLARTLCIFFMVGVHIFPGAAQTTYLNGGPANPVWIVYIEFLGRASVAALSFFSGFILSVYGAKKTIAQTTYDKFRTIYVPMVSWNLIMIAVIALSSLYTGRALSELFYSENILEALNRVFAITDRPQNLPLGFLRDLFVSLVLVRLLLPILRNPKLGLGLLGISLTITLLQLSDPVILRPNIFVFVLAGTLAAQHGWTIRNLSNWQLTLTGALVFAVLFVVVSQIDFGIGRLNKSIPNLVKRIMLTFIMFAVTHALAKILIKHNFAKIRNLLFLTYLSHGVTANILRDIWRGFEGDTSSGSYMVFFAGNIVLFFVIGALLRSALSHAPPLLKRALSG